MIDTAAERYSAANVMCPWRLGAVPPDGATTSGERFAVGYLYAFGSEAITPAGRVCLQGGAIRVSKATGQARVSKATGNIRVSKATGTIEVC